MVRKEDTREAQKDTKVKETTKVSAKALKKEASMVPREERARAKAVFKERVTTAGKSDTPSDFVISLEFNQDSDP